MPRYMLITDHFGKARNTHEEKLKNWSLDYGLVLGFLADMEENKNRDINNHNQFYGCLPYPVKVTDLETFRLTYHTSKPSDTPVRQIRSAALLRVSGSVWNRLMSLHDWKYSRIARAIIELLDDNKLDAAKFISERCNLNWLKLLTFRTYMKGPQYKAVRQHVRARLYAQEKACRPAESPKESGSDTDEEYFDLEDIPDLPELS